MWAVIGALVSFLLSTSVMFVIIVFNSCGGLEITKYNGAETLFLLFLFLSQLLSWILQKRKLAVELP